MSDGFTHGRGVPISAEMIRPGHGVLFVNSQGIGDVVQTLPLLRAACSWAENRLRCPMYVLFASPERCELVREEKLTMVPVFIQTNHNHRHPWLGLWRDLFGKVDLIISAPDISVTKLALLRHALGARYVIGEASSYLAPLLTASARHSWTRPWSEALHDIALSAGLAIPLPVPEIHLTPHEIAWADMKLEQANLKSADLIVGVHSASAVPQKSWPVRNFAMLIRLLRTRFPTFNVISFGNRAELAQAEQTRMQAGDLQWLEGAGQWTTRQTMAMLGRCDLFISGDTGLMHIAAALGVPTVSIFGPTSASRRAPQQSRGVAICPNRTCHPCFRRKWKPCECIRSITPERVLAAASHVLSEISHRKFADELNVV